MERRSTVTPRDLECMLSDETAQPMALPLQLLEDITDGFSNEHLIRRGRNADVYKGMLGNRTVAVKRMTIGYSHEKEFLQQVKRLMMVKHKNILRFLGYCAETHCTMVTHEGKFVMADVNQRLLCFVYLPNGSLDKYITDTSSGLQWRDRFQIITGICQGLHYLHQKGALHLDLKPKNILLDDNLVPKIADFSTSIRGTVGYIVPEYYNDTKFKVTPELSPLFDICSLGIIIIEILTGRKGNIIDADEVVENWRNRVEKSQSDVQMEQVRVCAEIGIGCTKFNPEQRQNKKAAPVHVAPACAGWGRVQPL